MLDEVNDYNDDYLFKNFGPDCIKKIAANMRKRNVIIMTEPIKT